MRKQLRRWVGQGYPRTVLPNAGYFMAEKGGESFQTGRVAAVASAHFIHDVYTSFLAPLLPLLIKKLGLSLAQAGSLSVFMQAPLLLNPLVGAFVDRKQLNRLLLAASPAVTAVCMCLIGVAPTYGALAVVLSLAGVSVAAMHLAGPVMVSLVAGRSVGRGMGIFMMGGELARTVGPVVAVWAASALSLEGLWQLIPVGVAASCVLWWRLPRSRRKAGSAPRASLLTVLLDMKGVIPYVVGMLLCRAFMVGAVTTYLPTFLYAEGQTLWLAGASLAVVELAGVAGALVSGTLSDRFGRRPVLLAVAVIAPAAMLAMLTFQGVLLVVALLTLGFSLLSSGPVLMAVMMENAGENRTTGNGLYMAFSFTVRALLILAVGAMSDAWGMRPTFTLCAFLGFFGIPFAFLVPNRPASNP